MEGLIVVSLLAGVLTVAAPCVLPLLPVIVGGSIVAEGADARRARWRPFVIAASLAVSVIVFTLLLKATTALLGVPTQVWQVISGVIVILLGINLLAPSLWERASTRLGLGDRSNRALDASVQRQSVGGDILTGAALGPVFSSCSPTYALIVATVLPVSFAEGLFYVTSLRHRVGCAPAAHRPRRPHRRSTARLDSPTRAGGSAAPWASCSSWSASS